MLSIMQLICLLWMIYYIGKQCILACYLNVLDAHIDEAV